MKQIDPIVMKNKLKMIKIQLTLMLRAQIRGIMVNKKRNTQCKTSVICIQIKLGEF